MLLFNVGRIEYLKYVDVSKEGVRTEGCEVRWVGKTSHANAGWNATELLMNLLKWETHTIGPMITLTVD